MQTHVSSQGFEYGVKHFLSPEEGALAEIISQTLNIDPLETQHLIKLGCVYINHKRTSQNINIIQNTLIRVHTKPRRYFVSYPWKDLIIYEDQDFIVLNKPGNIPSHPSVDNLLENALTQTSLTMNHPLFITHRLDSLTEGLIVYGKTTAFVNQFNKVLSNRQIEKHYVAIVETANLLPQKLIHYMEKSPRAPKKMHSHFVENSDLCELEIIEQKIKTESDTSWIKINLLTGRTHQIRSQLSAVDAPIVGDTLYGAKTPASIGDTSDSPNATPTKPKIYLRAQSLKFPAFGKIHEFTLNEDFE